MGYKIKALRESINGERWEWVVVVSEEAVSEIEKRAEELCKKGEELFVVIDREGKEVVKYVDGVAIGK